MRVYAVMQVSHLYCALKNILAADEQAIVVLLAPTKTLSVEFARLALELRKHPRIQMAYSGRFSRVREARYALDLLRMRRLVRKMPQDFELVSFGWSGSSLFPAYTRLFDAASSVTLVEDAPFFEHIPADNWAKMALKRVLFRRQYVSVANEKVRVAYLSRPCLVSPELRDRARPLLEFANINNVPARERDWLRELFRCPRASDVNGDASVVLTQPIALDFPGVTRRDQIRVFCEIVDRLPGTVYVKKHPRDEVDYPLDPSVRELRQFVPAELMRDEGLVFRRAVGLTSNAIDALSASERIKLFPALRSDWKIADLLASVEENLPRQQ